MRGEAGKNPNQNLRTAFSIRENEFVQIRAIPLRKQLLSCGAKVTRKKRGKLTALTAVFRN
jgi:hypothetical protein